MKKALIVYFSATGNTKAAAQRVRHQRRKHRRWLIQRPQESLSAVQMGREEADELKIEN